jgi:hypothetical protein
MTPHRPSHAPSSFTASPRARLAALFAPELLAALEELVVAQVEARLAAAGALEAPLVRSDRCGVPNRKILEHIRAGLLAGVRVDGRLYVRRVDLDVWIAQHAIAPPAQQAEVPSTAANDTETERTARLRAELEADLAQPPKPARTAKRRRA